MTTATRQRAPKSDRSLARVMQLGVVLLVLVIVQLWLEPAQAVPAAATVRVLRVPGRASLREPPGEWQW